MDAEYHINKSYINAPLSIGNIELFQIGRLFLGGGGSVAPHLHRRWFELSVITDGEGLVSADGEAVAVRAGDIFLSFPAEVHAITSSRDAPMHFDFFAFYTEDPTLSAALEAIVRNAPTAEGRRFGDNGIRPLIGAMLDELEGEGAPFGDRLLGLLAEEAVLRLCRALAVDRASAASGGDRLAFRLMQYIDAHVFTLRGVQELGEIFGYNYSYLSSLFKHATGSTLAEYFRAARWRVARLLLREGKASITEIAEMVGYSSVYVFSRAYRAHFGVPPSRDRGE